MHTKQKIVDVKMLLLLFGSFIAGVGHQFVYIRCLDWSETGCQEEDLRDPCPNQAATWLLVMGISLVLTHLVVRYKECLWLIFFLLDFGLLIWGTCLMFLRYPSWTANWSHAQQDPSLNYCEKLPMITACVSVIFIWISFVMVLVDTCIVLSRKGIAM